MSRQRDVLSLTPTRATPVRTRGGEVNDLRRAVVELARVRGWQLPPAAEEASTAPLPGLVFVHSAAAPSEVAWPDLTLVRRLDRRLVFAMLAPDRASTLSPRRRLVIDLLGVLRWNASSDERRRAELALGRPAPSIEAFIWRPADLLTGTIDEVLR